MSVVVRRVGPEAAADVLAVVREAFGARPVLDPPADALGEDVDSIARLLRRRGGFLATLDPEDLDGLGFRQAFERDFEELLLPAITIETDGGRLTAINDISFHRLVGGRVAQLAYGVEGEEAHGDVSVDQLDLAAELSGADGSVATPDVAEYALWLGDDSLVLAQQLGWWISRAPELEEDVALGNIGLDVLGHARSFLRYAGTADGRSEDDLAYWRDEPAFRKAVDELWPYALGVLPEEQRSLLCQAVERDEGEAIERDGHTEGLRPLWDEMTMVRRSVPGASW